MAPSLTRYAPPEVTALTADQQTMIELLGERYRQINSAIRHGISDNKQDIY